MRQSAVQASVDVDQSRISTGFCFQRSPGAAQTPVVYTHPDGAVASVVQTHPGATQAPGCRQVQASVVQAPPGAVPAPVFHTSPGASQAPVVQTRPGATHASGSVDTVLTVRIILKLSREDELAQQKICKNEVERKSQIVNMKNGNEKNQD